MHRFERLAGEGRHVLAAGDHGGAARLLGEALGLWRGPALADVIDAPFAGERAARLAYLPRAREIEMEAQAEFGGGLKPSQAHVPRNRLDQRKKPSSEAGTLTCLAACSATWSGSSRARAGKRPCWV
ncbi:BTAD domain-containing putative transcriptional regulator [Nonomuraea africana]|uniref:BTAD domain-containing putative transcriptional regulator n=1 Tax=Nonomuraea africana TaxID=46171 RepID=UPI003CD09F40